MLGIPDRDRRAFHGWSNAVIKSTASRWGMLMLIPSMLRFMRYIRRILALRRAEPRDDLLSALVQAEESGDQLSEDELVAMVMLLLIAGHETTVNLIGNGTFALLSNPDQLARLKAEPALIKPAIEELLRYESPVEMATERYAREDIELAGTVIPRGSLVLLVLASANRDEAQFPRRGYARHQPRTQPAPGVRAGHPLLPRRAAGPVGRRDRDQHAAAALAGTAPRRGARSAKLATWPDIARDREVAAGIHSRAGQRRSTIPDGRRRTHKPLLQTLKSTGLHHKGHKGHKDPKDLCVLCALCGAIFLGPALSYSNIPLPAAIQQPGSKAQQQHDYTGEQRYEASTSGARLRLGFERQKDTTL